MSDNFPAVVSAISDKLYDLSLAPVQQRILAENIARSIIERTEWVPRGECAQMRLERDYALRDANLARDRAERYYEALAWYANPNRYRVGKWPERDDDPTYDGSILPDNGQRAREAMSGES